MRPDSPGECEVNRNDTLGKQRSRLNIAPTRPLATLIALMAYGLVSMTICLPSMREWGVGFGADAPSVQMTFTGFVLTYGALQLVYGPLSDRHGRRGLLQAGVLLATAASVWAASTTTLTGLVLARVLQGAGCAACLVLSRAAIQDLYTGEERTRAMAYSGMAIGVCPPLATVVGGQMHEYFGWASNFLLLAFLGCILWLATTWWVPSTRPPAAPQTTHWFRAMAKSYRLLLSEPVFVLNALILSLCAASFYAYLGGVPLVLGHYGIRPAHIGFYIMVIPLSYMLGNLLTTRIVRRVGERRIATAGHVLSLSALAVVLMVAAAGLRTPLSFVLPLALMGIGHGLLIPPTLGATVGLMPALAGAAAAVAGVMQQLIGAGGAYASGWVPHDGPFGTALLMLACAIGAATAHMWLPRAGAINSR
jgi:DHA1 family bicyclomycin/chloramphenicol resistance-like MFS transporter